MDPALFWTDVVGAVVAILILALQAGILNQLAMIKEIAMALEDLKSAIEHSHSVQAAAVVLIRDLADKIADLSRHPDEAELSRLAQELREKADELAGAIALHDKGEDELEE